MDSESRQLNPPRVANVGDSYPLSSLQAGMLFNHLYMDSPGVDLIQAVVTMPEEVKPDLLESAWRRAVAQFAVLRTSFEYEDLSQPVQHVHASAELDFRVEDLHALSAPEQDRALSDYLKRDGEQGFDLSRAPLIRLRLFRLQDRLWKLVWTFHHIILDGRGAIIVLRGALAVYDAAVQGQTLELPAEVPYRSFIEQVGAVDSTQAADFWRKKLSGLPGPTPLPADSAGLKNGSHKAVYKQRELQIPADLTARLAEIAAAESITLNTVAQGIWALLLSRYSGESDIVFGSSKTVRQTVKGGKLMVGLLLATVPIRTQVDETISVANWLRGLREEWLSHHGFEHTPLTVIQEASDLPSGTRPFDTLVVFENDHWTRSFQRFSPQCAGRDLSVRYSNTGYALTLLAFGGAEINLTLCYDSNRFSDSTIDRVLRHLQLLLEQIAADPQRTISSLSLVTEEQRAQLDAWNDTAREYRPACVHHMFEQQVRRTPEAIAVIHGDEAVTYRELNSRANRLARHLQSHDVRPGSLVGICMPRSVNMLAAVLATLKAGAAYVPLDPDYPPERLAFMLEDCGATVLLTDSSLTGLAAENTPAIHVDQISQVVHDLAAEDVQSGATLDDLAYVIYTSGSTGKPKGVCLSHRALSNLVFWQLENSSAQVGDRTLQFTSLSFDVSFQEIFSTWCSGGALVMVSNSLRRDSSELLRFMRDLDVRRLFLPFVALQSLAEVAEDEALLPNLREVITAGEQLQITPQISRLFERLPNCSLHNHYGPSETHVVTAFTLRGEPRTWPLLPPIGRPIANTQAYVLDAHLRTVPVGISGELYFGGTALARGYWNRPELTAERFIEIAAGSGRTRVYKTGDIGRYLPNGDIEYLGRADNQVKIRGHRVEPGEVEALLRQVPGIRDAVVTVQGTGAADKRLAAYVIPADRTSDAELPRQAREFLKHRVPEYMVPAAFAVLSSFPLTPSGKINRRALPPMEDAAAPRAAQAPPRNRTESQIHAIWTEVLKADQIGIHDNFFEFGHSLQATQVASRIRRTFNVELPLRVLFERPTIADLAQYVQEVRHASTTAMEIVPVDRDQRLPLSFAQQRMWFIHQMQPDNPVYNLPLAVRLSGALDVDALEQSLNEIVRRHEILRTTFKVEADVPYQQILSAFHVRLEVCDAQSTPAEERQSRIQEFLYSEALPPFDLEHGPLLRTRLVKFAPQDHVLFITLHHIVGDAWSAGVLFDELSALYPAFAAAKPSPLSPLLVQYADYAAAQRGWLQGKVLEQQLAFWRKELQGAPTVLELPTDKPRPREQSFRGAWQPVTLPHTLLQSLKELSQRHGVTLFMTLMAAFQVLLGRYAQSEDFVIGTDLANRTSVETEKLIGFFINVLPIRAKLAGNPAFVELLKRVRETTVNAFAHQEMPLEKLVEELQPERGLSHNPLVQVLFVLQNAPKRCDAIGGMKVSPVEFDITLSKFDLAVFLEERDGALSAGWLYVADLFEPGTIARMAQHYETLLSSIVAQPEARIANLEMLTHAEKESEVTEKLERQEAKTKKLKMAKRKALEAATGTNSGGTRF